MRENPELESDMSNKPVWTEDGRSGEKRVKEVADGDGAKRVYEELWVEPKQEKRLAKRQVKHIRPVEHTIETEIIDEDTQEVIDRKVESIDPDSKMELRRHLVSEATLSAQSADKEDCDCWVTRDELKDAIVAAVKAVSSEDADNDYYVENYSEPTAPVASAQSVLEEKYDGGGSVAAKSGNVWTVVLASACMVLAGGIVAVLVM